VTAALSPRHTCKRATRHRPGRIMATPHRQPTLQTQQCQCSLIIMLGFRVTNQRARLAPRNTPPWRARASSRRFDTRVTFSRVCACSIAKFAPVVSDLDSSVSHCGARDNNGCQISRLERQSGYNNDVRTVGNRRRSQPGAVRLSVMSRTTTGECTMRGNHVGV
jgi:hypothetical protein